MMLTSAWSPCGSATRLGAYSDKNYFEVDVAEWIWRSHVPGNLPWHIIHIFFTPQSVKNFTLALIHIYFLNFEANNLKQAIIKLHFKAPVLDFCSYKKGSDKLRRRKNRAYNEILITDIHTTTHNPLGQTSSANWRFKPSHNTVLMNCIVSVYPLSGYINIFWTIFKWK